METQNQVFGALTPADAMLSRFRLCETSNVEEAIHVVERIFCKHAVYSKSPHFKTRVHHRSLGCVGMTRLTYGGDAVIVPGVMDKFALVQLAIRGHESVESNGKQFFLHPAQGIVLNAHANIRLCHTENTEKLILRFDRDLLLRRCQQHVGRTLHKDLEFQEEIALDTPQGKNWLQTVSWAYHLLSVNDELPPLLHAQIESVLVDMLLLCQQHNYSGELGADKSASIAPSFVRRVERYIEENSHEPIGIGDLAEFAGVSTRTLFTGFRKFRNTTPMNYLKEVRLRHVHEELLRASPASSTVTSVAFRWGFSHLGHFTTDYKRRFGNTPSETLARSCC